MDSRLRGSDGEGGETGAVGAGPLPPPSCPRTRASRLGAASTI